MGTLADIGAVLNPEMAQKFQQYKNNADQKSALMTLADQAQQNQQPSPQQLDQNGKPMNAQAQAAIAPFLQKLATMNQGNMQVGAAGNNPAAFQQAQQAQMMTQSPFAAIQMQIPIQQQQADLVNKNASSIKDGISTDAAGNNIHLAPSDPSRPVSATNPLVQTVIGVNSHYISPQGKNLEDLNKFQQLNPSAANGSTGQQGQNTPTGGVGGLINQAFMTDAQKAAAAAQQEEQAKAVQAAKEDVVNVNNMAQQSMAGIDQLHQINQNPHLPRGGFGMSPEQQAELSNQVGQTTGTPTPVADAYNSWNQTSQGKIVQGVKDFMASSTGQRLDLPLVQAIKSANIPTPEGSQKATDENINKFATNIYNAQIMAKNRLAQLQNPNAPTLPIKPLTAPFNPKAQTFTMDQVMQKAQQRGMKPNDVINAIHSSGNWVQQ